jgi:hypothetical protein
MIADFPSGGSPFISSILFIFTSGININNFLQDVNSFHAKERRKRRKQKKVPGK